MITAMDLLNGLRSKAVFSIEEFEDWFDRSSWNVHQQNDQRLTDAVFAIEAIFSDYYSMRLSADSVKAELCRVADRLSDISFDFAPPVKKSEETDRL
jgi:hypothetical protein